MSLFFLVLSSCPSSLVLAVALLWQLRELCSLLQCIGIHDILV